MNFFEGEKNAYASTVLPPVDTYGTEWNVLCVTENNKALPRVMPRIELKIQVILLGKATDDTGIPEKVKNSRDTVTSCSQ